MDDVRHKLQHIVGSLDNPRADIQTLLDEALDGNLHSALVLFAAVFPGWAIGDGIDQPIGKFVAKLYAPDDTIIEGEGQTFLAAVLDAIIQGKALAA
ncbi:hypothetical protein [Aquamicrobium terrae]|uniref:Uncharacterized protein n=1 Tax=Aquamicrobium terrae TaxID=1324945 RepID=A0ABV2MY70_9HYPH